jgi:Protein of unknown function (DUF4233)
VTSDSRDVAPNDVDHVATDGSEAAPPIAPRGLYAIGSAGLALEALVLLLAAPAVITLERGDVHWLRVGALFGLAILLILAAAMLRRPWGKTFGTITQVLAVACGIVVWPMYVVGLAFAAIWVYWLRLWPKAEPRR